MRYNDIFSRFLRTLSFLLIFGLATSGCTDDFLPGLIDEIPEGETEFMVEVDYKAFAGVTLDPSTRGSSNPNADGKGVKRIESLAVVAYLKDADDEWTLADGFPLEITPGSHGLTTEEVAAFSPDGANVAEDRTWRASFRMRMRNGIYRMYAVANFDLSGLDRDEISTPGKLRELALEWDPDNLANNSEMFGPISNSDGFDSGDPVVTVTPGCSLHAWLRRAVSKVTVAFDTSDLLDDIDIYLKSVSLKDIPSECYLGSDNTPGSDDRTISSTLIPTGPTLYFGNAEAAPDDYRQWTPISKSTGVWGYRSEMGVPGAPATSDPARRKEWEHDESTDALYMYENMQGVSWKDKSQSVASPSNGWGWTDNIGYPNPVEGDPSSGWKDMMAYGSYVEVEAYYVCRIKGREQQAPIKYRFMLGRNTTTDYNADRNSHFRLTLKFKGMANDADWHVDYKEPVLTVASPRIFDYRGMVFYEDKSIHNWGNDFRKENQVRVASYEGSRDLGYFREFKIEYREPGETSWKSQCPWLSHEIRDVAGSPVEKDVMFYATSRYKDVDIDADLLAKREEKGKSARYNLSHPSGTPNAIQETANTYIVDAKGKYVFPLIYGNGYAGGVPNKNAYEYPGSGTGEMYLKKFRNHLGNDISSPEILKNAGCSNPKDAVLIWQDAKDLVANITLDRTAFAGKGGIAFDVPDPRQGNAVIALRDQNGRVMWSWQIWVTCMDFNGLDPDFKFDETIPVTGYKYAGIFKMMPFNLGWNSEGEKIRLYPRRECEVRISSGMQSHTITIHQESHIAVPRGTNTYYQWGRKDPFVGSGANYQNKERYTPTGTLGVWDGPKRMYDDWYNKVKNPGQYPGVDRQTTRQALHLWVLHPDVWFNPPRKQTAAGIEDDYEPTDKTYRNLWCSTASTNAGAHFKTVYDPCPPGYMVPNRLAFTGFTDGGNNINYTSSGDDKYVWDVRPDQIGAGCPTKSVYEFYTDSRKVQSICFPESGYRDWDGMAQVYWLDQRGFCWTNEKPVKATVEGENIHELPEVEAFNFMFTRAEKLVFPQSAFYATDGFPVRPCRY